MIASGPGAFADPPEGEADKFAQLTAALVAKKQALLAEAEEARHLATGYEEFIEAPETLNDDRPALRKNVLHERARYQKLQSQAAELQSAIRSLRNVPDERSLSLSSLREAYSGLGELGERGKAAWSQLLTDREISLEVLQAGYARDLAEATGALEGLHTAERATQLLLDAIDSRRSEATDAEFRDSLQLPRIMSAVTLGFGLKGNPDDREVEAQITLVALIGYSQFFWDYYTGARSHLTESEFPRDHARNIFGIADGGVVTSDAIAENRSSLYYLSDAAKEKFNGRIQGIWGPDATVSVKAWDQTYARTFHQACEALSTPTEMALLPNEQAFDLLDALDALIAERTHASRSIETIHADYAERLANVKRFDEKSSLSSAHYNAEIWAREAERTIAGFEAAHRFLDEQVAASAQEDWTPNPRRITASIQTLRSAHNRVHSVHKVKAELTALLQ